MLHIMASLLVPWDFTFLPHFSQNASFLGREGKNSRIFYHPRLVTRLMKRNVYPARKEEKSRTAQYRRYYGRGRRPLPVRETRQKERIVAGKKERKKFLTAFLKGRFFQKVKEKAR